MSGRDSLPGHTDLICYTSLSFKSCESPVSHPYHLNPHLSSFSSNLQFSFKFWRKKHALSFHRAFFQRAKHARGRSNTSKRTLRNETLWKKALWNEWIPVKWCSNDKRQLQKFFSGHVTWLTWSRLHYLTDSTDSRWSTNWFWIY